MKKIIPIKELRNTNEISRMCHLISEPIYISKNGYSDLVIMSDECFENLGKNEVELEETPRLYASRVEKQDQANGYIKVCSLNFPGNISDVDFNKTKIVEAIKKAFENEAKIIVLPELCLSSYSCGDLFFSDTLLKKVIKAIDEIMESTKDIEAFYTFGAPLIFQDKLYNCAICAYKGKILGVVPKTYVPNYNEFYEKRYFEGYESQYINQIQIGDNIYPFSNNLLFRNARLTNEIIGVEICEDMWVNSPRSSVLSSLGATIICNLSSSNETIEKEEIRRKLIETNCYRSKVGYIYSSASFNESSSDLIFSGHNIICEPDGIIKESELFDSSSIYSEIDLDRIMVERRMQKYNSKNHFSFQMIDFSCSMSEVKLTRSYQKYPFINKNNTKEEMIKIHNMQAKALERRLRQINCKNVVIGVSGGLDSTIALLCCINTFDNMKLPRTNIHAITLPCFGTTSRTKDNATIMCEKLGVNLLTIDIKKSVDQHLKDLKISKEDQSIAFENSQARERTQVLMDYCNKVNGIVIGTGDLSEIALGWSTYNGDHMSMYNVNCSLPKTLIRSMTYYLSDVYPEIKEILLDILDTPISPELLPPKEGEIAQITEDVIGPYVLHDFFLYHFIYHKQDVKKVFFMAKETFKEDYDEKTIKKWFTHFIKRFFNNQFKRSCCPDGPKITQVSLSPRGDFRMPSDTSGNSYLRELENL